ncbi:HISAT acetyltransferase, partial [Amia calva]|nr:HISAT acetyltransferase [Amia calva]
MGGSQSDELEFCLGTEQDFEQVLDISEGSHDGLDYMAVTYHCWLKEPGRMVFLAKKQGKVALESALLVDGGETVVLQGLRVHPAQRGLGVAGAIQRHVSQYLRTHCPLVATRRLARGDDPGPEALSKYRLLSREAILTLCGEVSELGPFLVDLERKLGQEAGREGVPQPVLLSQEAAETLVLSEHVVRNLLPAGNIINDWEPLKPIESNLEILRRRGLTWVADRAELPAALSLCTTPYRVPYRPDAYHFNINIFGSDQTRARLVFLAQLRQLLPSLCGYVIFHNYVHPSLWPGMREFCRSSAGVSLFRDYWEELMLETDI